MSSTTRRWGYAPTPRDAEALAEAQLLDVRSYSSSQSSAPNARNIMSPKTANVLGNARSSSYGTAMESSRSKRVENVLFRGLYGGGGGGGGGGGQATLADVDVEADTTSLVDAMRRSQGGGLMPSSAYRAISNAGTGKRCCGGRVTRRTGWAIAVASIVILAVVMGLVGYFAIAPGYVQTRIAETSLVFTRMTLRNPQESEQILGRGGDVGIESNQPIFIEDRDGVVRRRRLATDGSNKQNKDSSQQHDIPHRGLSLVSSSSSSSSSPPHQSLKDDATTQYTFLLDIDAILSNLSPVDGVLGAFQATLRHEGADVATVSMPSLSAKAGVDNYLSFSAPVQVLSFTDFAFFGDAIVNSDLLSAELIGTTSVSTTVAGVTVSVNNIPFAKTVTFPGCGGLKKSLVTEFSLARSNATNAIVDLIVSVENPSIVGIQPLGDIAVRIYYQGVDMGTATAVGATLSPGITNLTLSGELFSTNATITEQLISGYLGNQAVTVQAIGEALPSSIPLYAPVLAALNLQATLGGDANAKNGGAVPIPLIASISVDGMFLEPQGASAVGVSLNVTVSVNNLLGPSSPIYVKTVAIDCTLEGEGQSLGQLIVPTTIVNGSSSSSLVAGTRMLTSASSSSSDPNIPLLNVTISMNAVLDISESDSQFAAFVLSFLQRDSVSLGLVSNATNSMTVSIACVLGDLTVSIPIDARTQVPGIGGFPYVSVDSFSVIGVSTTDSTPTLPAIITAITVSMLNPSPATFPLGANATLGLYVEGQRLGESVLYNKTLLPGMNTFDLIGVIAPPNLAALSATSGLFSDFLIGKNSTVTVIGEDVNIGDDDITNGGITPAWLLAAVKNISLDATVPGIDAVTAANLLVNTTVESLDLDFGADGKAVHPQVSGTVRAVLQLPFSIPVTLGTADIVLDFVEVSTGIVMARLELNDQTSEWYPCNSTVECAAVTQDSSAFNGRRRGSSSGDGDGDGDGDGGVSSPLAIASSFSSSSSSSSSSPLLPPLSQFPIALAPIGVLYIHIGPGELTVYNVDAFARLVTSVVASPFVALQLNGTASPRVTTAIGTLNITGVPLNQTVELQGLNSFTYPPIDVIGGDITNTSANTVSLIVTFNITNLSRLTSRLGPVSLVISYMNASFITSSVDCLSLGYGSNLLQSIGTFELPDKVTRYNDYLAAKDALSRFLRGISSNVTVTGALNSSPNPLLQPAFSQLTADASFPGMNVTLVQNGTLFLSLDTIPSPGDIGVASLDVANVLSVDMSITNASLTVFLCKTETGPNTCDTIDDYHAPIGFFYNGDLSKDPSGPILIPAHTEKESARYNITLLSDTETLASLFADLLFYGDLVTKVNGTLTAKLQRPAGNGESASEPFSETVFYEQPALRLYRVDP